LDRIHRADRLRLYRPYRLYRLYRLYRPYRDDRHTDNERRNRPYRINGYVRELLH
jgi:hypothetical protein